MEALDAFKKFSMLVETSLGKKVKTFRTDNGGEFTSKEFNKYYEEAGINRHYFAPYSPQQNSIVERQNRTLIEMARSLLKKKKCIIVYRVKLYDIETICSTDSPHELLRGLRI